MSAKPPTDPNSSFSAIVLLAIQGDHVARNKVLLFCSPPMLFAIRKALKGRRLEESTDILHDALIRLADSLGFLQNPESVIPFSCVIARRQTGEYLSKTKGNRMIPIDMVHDEGEVSLEDVESMAPYERAELHLVSLSVKTKAFKLMSERQRTIYEKLYIQDMSNEDVATALNISSNLVYQETFQIRKLFQGLL